MIGIFVDTSDLYHKVKRRLDGKLCYENYYNKINDWGTIHQSFAYVMQTDHEASGFITCLKALGFNVKFKKPRIMRIDDREIKQCNWGVELTIDVVKTVGRLDTVVLGVSSPDYIPLVEWIKDQGVKVIILACGVPWNLKQVADEVVELDEEYLEEEEDDINA